MIVVGTHADRVTDRNTLTENMRLVKTMYGDKDNQLEGVCVRVCACVCTSVCVRM